VIGRADQQHVGFLLDEPQRRELVHQGAVDAGLRGEVELLQRLGRREPGEPHPAGETALLGRLHLDVEQVVQELRVPRLVLLRLLERGGELLGHRGQLQIGEMAAKVLVAGVLVHRATLAIRAY
jgi:hypothetical protein